MMLDFSFGSPHLRGNMPAFQKPAPKPVDDALFRDSPPEVRELNKRSRKELRTTNRRAYAYSTGIPQRRN